MREATFQINSTIRRLQKNSNTAKIGQCLSISDLDKETDSGRYKKNKENK